MMDAFNQCVTLAPHHVLITVVAIGGLNVCSGLLALASGKLATKSNFWCQGLRVVVEATRQAVDFLIAKRR